MARAEDGLTGRKPPYSCVASAHTSWNCADGVSKALLCTRPRLPLLTRQSRVFSRKTWAPNPCRPNSSPNDASVAGGPWTKRRFSAQSNASILACSSEVLPTTTCNGGCGRVKSNRYFVRNGNGIKHFLNCPLLDWLLTGVTRRDICRLPGWMGIVPVILFDASALAHVGGILKPLPAISRRNVSSPSFVCPMASTSAATMSFHLLCP